MDSGVKVCNPLLSTLYLLGTVLFFFLSPINCITTLNKIVEIDFFDHMCDGMEVGYCGQPFQYKLNSFARVDNGAHEKAMGVNHDISDKYYAYKVGSITKTTDIFREYGWHTFKWDYTSGSDVKMYIDGKLVATSVADSFNYIEMGDYGMGGFNAYDNVVIYGGDSADAIIPLPPQPDNPDIEEKPATLPGKIQAEDASKLPNGVQITSISGGKAVGYLSPNTVFEFDLEVTEACELPLTVRYASPKDTGSLELTIGEKTISASSFPKTGDGDNGWNTYKEFTTSDKIALTPGKYTAQVKIIDNNFNFDWFALMDKAPIKPDTAVESVEFNIEGNLLLSVGNATKIPYTVLPKTAANKAVTFESSNLNAVTVAEDGTVTAIAVGTSEITVTTADGAKTATCMVEVLDAEASLISTTAKGCVPTATSFDHVNYQAEKLMDGDITKSWAAAGSSNPAHLSDPSAYFTWNEPQDINTIYLYDNFEATNYVKSMEIIFDDDEANAYQIPTGVPDGGMLKITLPQIKNGVKKIEFHITDAAGQYGNYGFGEIKVFSEEPGLIPVNSIRFAEDSTVKFVGETFTIKQPVITPSTATDQAFTMEVTGDEGVIRVTENRTDGKLTGYTITTLKEGKAAIEVTAAGGAKGKFEVTVGSKQAIENAIMKAEALYSKYPGDSEAKITFRAAIDEALKVYRESNDLTKIAEAIEALQKASDEFESSVSSGETAQDVADKLTVENPIKGSTSIKLPIVPVGYKVTIVSSSNEAVIAKNGSIKSPDTEAQVNLTFKVTKVSDSTTGTKTLPVTVAGYSAEDAMNEIEISNPAKGAVKLILPTAPYGFKLEIVSSTENIISKDGTITPQLESKEVTLSVKMTKISNNNFFNKDFTVTIIGTVKPFDVAIEAKDIDAVHGSAIKVQNNEVVNFNPGDWIRYDYVDFGKSPKNIKAKLNLAVHPDWAGKTIKIIMDDVTSGTALGEMVVDAGGAADWGQYHYQETDLTGRISGLHTIYLLGVAGGKNPTEGVAGVKEIQFTDVTPEGIKVESIAIKTAPTKTVYEVGEELDVTGGKITVTYSDKTNAEVNMTASMITGFDSDTAGTKTLTVTYEEKEAPTTFTVTVKEVTPPDPGKVDKAELKALYDLNVDRQNKNYTVSSWSSFTKALADAKAVLDNADAEQKDVNKALGKLQDAISKLKTKPEDKPAPPANNNGGGYAPPANTTIDMGGSGASVNIPDEVTNISAPSLSVVEVPTGSKTMTDLAAIAPNFTVLKAFNVDLYDGSSRVTLVEGGRVRVELPFNGQYGTEYVVLRYNDNNTITQLPASYSNNVISFETDHFSTFAIAVKSNKTVTPPPTSVTDPSTPPATGVSEQGLPLSILCMLIATCSYIIVRRKRSV